MEKLTINATASVVPEKCLTNDELATMVETSDEWIRTRTGIQQRYVATHETTTDLAVSVAEKLLITTGWSAEDLDFIIVATMSPDTLTPSVSAGVQGRLGANNAFAMDMGAACAGFIYALSTATMLLQTRYQKGLVIGAETLSRLVDWEDRRTAVLFGDGAAGVAISQTHNETGLLAEHLSSFGELGHFLTAGQIAQESPFFEHKTQYPFAFNMDGRQVYNFATAEVPKAILAALQKARVTIDEVDYFICHQANARIIQSIANHLDQSIEKFPMNMAQYGNTSAASVGLLLHELNENGLLKTGQTIVLAGFGGGLTVGALVIRI
ncbi:ketoacyl-ACP synthase III [Weissella ceti]|uniref:Beta-ketoacyl-[acyl-carrier-protein] synthase III n=1 Tax=Weissella ceti TaxID=759620 RepID=A0ABT3E408_9LACO|nr:beta-ketoacyl-ACP synthase III [Weissella ceti]MCW0953141.1 ketoacyl-ACP synthase III [Weissella ceti]QVK12660.1 ketoacyl-ACP synthase III [Weissella ceti]